MFEYTKRHLIKVIFLSCFVLEVKHQTVLSHVIDRV
jgi:hypothetical protein